MGRERALGFTGALTCDTIVTYPYLVSLSLLHKSIPGHRRLELYAPQDLAHRIARCVAAAASFRPTFTGLVVQMQDNTHKMFWR